jgi:predicted TIM-barrel fold metal-dependent hydrolase
MIIDAHAHIMNELHGQTGRGPTRSLDYGKVQYGDEVIQLLPPLMEKTAFPPEALLGNMDWAGVDKAVLLQGPFYGEANDYIAHAVKQWPDRFIGAGHIDPCTPDARDMFQRCVDERGFRILKFEMSVGTGLVGLYPDLRLDGEEMAWIWEEAERRGLIVTLDLGAVGSASYQTDGVRNILERHPHVRIVICHLAQPPMVKSNDADAEQLWQEQIRLAKHPNVWFDVSALPAYASNVEDYPYPRARAYIRRAVEMVGVDKLMWGTDAPGLLGQATYPQLLRYITHHCDFLSEQDIAKIMGGKAQQVYGNQNA